MLYIENVPQVCSRMELQSDGDLPFAIDHYPSVNQRARTISARRIITDPSPNIHKPRLGCPAYESIVKGSNDGRYVTP